MEHPPAQPPSRLRPLLTPVSRGVAGFFGGFTLLNLVGDLLAPGFDGNFWWINLHPVPAVPARLLLLISAGLLLAFAARPAASRRRRRATACAAAALSAFAAWNAVEFFILLARGRLHSGFPVPLSLLVLAALLLVLRQTLRLPATADPSPAARRLAGTALVATLLACAVGFPLVQMLCYGLTDYRDYCGPGRHADAIVVFGARTYADGTPSQALADRVRTACDLYRRGYADKLIFSGGPGDGATDEPQAMRSMALANGVPDFAIYCDPDGLNTDATVRNTQPLFEKWHVRHVLAVSHAYHLPRVKMAYRRLSPGRV